MSDQMGAMKDQAVAWLIRQRDADFDDWDGFEAWLAADPARAAAYHQAAAADRDLDALLAGARWPGEPAARPIVAANDAGPTRRRWIGGAVAAAVALTAVTATWTWRHGAEPYMIQTAAGERRVIRLADSVVELNGDTRIALDRRDPRFAALEHGQAMFEVRHDDARPFRVKAGGRTLVDAGTAFEVTSDPGRLEVAVSEGLVIADPDGQAVRIPAGARLVERGHEAEVSPVRPDDVGTWRQGQLVYDGASLDRVATDLQRNLGVRVAVADKARGRTVRGVIRLDGGATPTMARLAALLGAKVEKSGEEWIIGGS